MAFNESGGRRLQVEVIHENLPYLLYLNFACLMTVICSTSILCRNQLSHKEFRNEIKAWLRKSFLNTCFINGETGYQIHINNTFIEKVTSSFGDIKAHALTAIPAIIEQAMFISAEDDKRERADIIKVLKFECPVVIDTTQYLIWIYIRQTKTQLQLYSLNINAQKTP